MRISVVVRAHNEERNLRATFESILMQQRVSKGDFELIVVDDASSDETPAIAEAFEREQRGHLCMRIVRVDVSSRGKALDAGFKAARCEWVASLDGDSVADPQWVRNILDHIEANPAEVTASGRLEFKEGPRYHRALYANLRSFWFQYFATRGLGFLSGANFWMRRDVFDKVGGTGAFIGKYDDKYLAVQLRRQIRQGLIHQQGHAGRMGYCPTALVFTDNWILRSRSGPFRDVKWAWEFVQEVREMEFVPELFELLKMDLSGVPRS